MQSLRETVFRRAHTSWSDMVRDTMQASIYSFVSNMAWTPGEGGPWAYTAVGPVDENNPSAPPEIYCSAAEIPANGFTDYIDTFQDWSSFAYGLELTGDPIFLKYAEKQIGGNLFTFLTDGAKNIENRAALIALLESAVGMP